MFYLFGLSKKIEWRNVFELAKFVRADIPTWRLNHKASTCDALNDYLIKNPCFKIICSQFSNNLCSNPCTEGETLKAPFNLNFILP